jgi:hypothetical protein
MQKHCTEVWKDVPGYEGCYQVSNIGRVKSLARRALRMDGSFHHMQGERFHKYSGAAKKYLAVGLCKNGKTLMITVHRLVLLAFIGPCPEGMECRHLDGNPKNNRLSNLCWGTLAEQAMDRERHGTNTGNKGKNRGKHYNQGEACGNAKLHEKDARKIRALHSLGTFNFVQLGKRFGVHRSTIEGIVKRTRWACVA